MTLLADDQVRALRDLAEFWPDVERTLVGASALACLMPGFHRGTLDLDVTVAVSLNDLPSEVNKPHGWRRDTVELRWTTPAGVKLDLIPAGPELLAAGQVVLPSGRVLSLRGFRHAFSSTCLVEVAPGFHVATPTVPVIALLKVIAYQERPHEREKDLGDIAFILANYTSDDDDRRYSSEVLGAEIQYEEVGPYLLGRDLRELVIDDERLTLRSFISLAKGDEDAGRTHYLMLRQAPIPAWREDPPQFLACIRAFERGLEAR